MFARYSTKSGFKKMASVDTLSALFQNLFLMPLSSLRKLIFYNDNGS